MLQREPENYGTEGQHSKKYYQKVETQTQESWTELRAIARNYYGIPRNLIHLHARARIYANVKSTCVGNTNWDVEEKLRCLTNRKRGINLKDF